MVVGVIMYAYPPVNYAGRQQAFGRRIYINEANKILASISRVVLHPKYRSIGLGIRLVKETLPLVGRPYVETTAVMAKYNTFFEKAGVTKISESHGDPSVLEAVKKLGYLGFRSYALASEEANLNHLRKLKPRDLDEVREILRGISSGYQTWRKRQPSVVSIQNRA